MIKVQSVKSKLVEDGYGYLRVTSFQENTVASLAKNLNDLYKPGPLKGLVLDLRNDPGGLLNTAIGVSAAFLPEKTLVTSTDGRTPDAKHQFYALPEDYLRGSREDALKTLPDGTRKVPMVVLINGGSASASEIVAGALQDHKRAVVMGTTSFRQGLGANRAAPARQYRDQADDGALLHARPAVRSRPRASFPTSSSRKPPMAPHPCACAKRTWKSIWKNGDKDAATVKPQVKTPPPKAKSGPVKDETDEPADAPSRELASKKDYQLGQAINLLKGLQIMQNKP